MKPHQLARRTDRETSKVAAKSTRAHTSQRARVLRLYEADAAELEPGLTADEVCECLGFDAWRRVSDLTNADIIVPLVKNGREVERMTRQGKLATVMVLA